VVRGRRTLPLRSPFGAREGRWPWLPEAAEALHMTRRGLERHLRGLENRGLVRLVRGPGRVRAVELAEGGGL
jgi:DNA-binding MarR family transcriptional regulator